MLGAAPIDTPPGRLSGKSKTGTDGAHAAKPQCLLFASPPRAAEKNYPNALA